MLKQVICREPMSFKGLNEFGLRVLLMKQVAFIGRRETETNVSRTPEGNRSFRTSRSRRRDSTEINCKQIGRM
jgi:hypothetical protein